ncbi:hypothetical protein QQ045_020765 [Rhodiola kirilowii]
MAESIVEEPVIEGKFEAHYKKVAAKNAEIEDQQKQFEASMLAVAKNNGESSTVTKKEDTENELKQLVADSWVEERPIGKTHYKKVATKNAEIEDQQKQFEASMLAVAKNNGESSTVTKKEDTENELKQLVADSWVEERPIGKSFAAENYEIGNQPKQVEDSPSLVEAPTVTELTAGWVSKCSIKEMTKLKPQKMTKVYKIHLEKKLDMLVDKDLKDNYDRIEVEELLQVGLLCTLSTSQATGQKCLKCSVRKIRLVSITSNLPYSTGHKNPPGNGASGSSVHSQEMFEVVRMLEGDGLAKKWEASQRAESNRSQGDEFSSSERYSDLTDDSSLLVQAMELSGPR